MTAPESQNSPLHLGDAINISTRSIHAKLNKLILQRLPLSLPPLSSTPSAYISGILHIAPVYIAFESLWQNILQPHETRPAEQPDCGPEGCEPGSPLLDSDSIVLFPLTSSGTSPNGGIGGGGSSSETLVHKPLVCDRVHSLLEHLHMPGLLRAANLRSDIGAVTGWPEHVVEEQLRAVSAQTSGALKDFVEHVKRSVEANPHVLLAYAWVLYMALFSGGRFIRGSLENAGHEFWSGRVEAVMTSAGEICVDYDPLEATAGASSHDNQAACLPLAFFRFDTPHDGEDLKVEFKKRLAESETLLTPGERTQVVQEAGQIFQHMIQLIGQLDGIFDGIVPEPAVVPNDTSTLPSRQATPAPAKALVSDSWESLLTPLTRGSMRLRDSVAVAKDRARARHQHPHNNNTSSSISKRADVENEELSRDDPEGAGLLGRSRSSTTTSASSVNAHSTVIPANELADMMTPPAASGAKTVHFENRPRKGTLGGRGSEQGPLGRGMDGVLDEAEGVSLSGVARWTAVRDATLFGGALAVLLAYVYVRR